MLARDIVEQTLQDAILVDDVAVVAVTFTALGLKHRVRTDLLHEEGTTRSLDARTESSPLARSA